MPIVYVSRCLSKRYPNVYLSILTACRENNIGFGIIKDNKNIWCRDYMPVPVDDYYVKFRYKTVGYDKYPQLKITDECYKWLQKKIVHSSIILDGGNCVRDKDRVFITDIIFLHNPQYRKIVLLNKLEKLLQAEIVLIPTEPYDDLGHADGIVKPIGAGSVFINDYSVMKGKIYHTYYNYLVHVLIRRHINCIPFSYAYHKKPRITEKQFRKKYPRGDAFNPGYGYYINFLQVGKMVVLPVFGIEEDELAISLVKRFLKPSITSVNCSDISMEGGLINCCTWEG